MGGLGSPVPCIPLFLTRSAHSTLACWALSPHGPVLLAPPAALSLNCALPSRNRRGAGKTRNFNSQKNAERGHSPLLDNYSLHHQPPPFPCVPLPFTRHTRAPCRCRLGSCPMRKGTGQYAHAPRCPPLTRASCAGLFKKFLRAPRCNGQRCALGHHADPRHKQIKTGLRFRLGMLRWNIQWLERNEYPDMAPGQWQWAPAIPAAQGRRPYGQCPLCTTAVGCRGGGAFGMLACLPVGGPPRCCCACAVALLGCRGGMATTTRHIMCK